MTVSKIKNPLLKVAKPQKKVSWSTFEKQYLTREDSWKYEWVDGIIEKTKRIMYPNQYFILTNLRDLFDELKHSKKLVTGYFEPETDVFFTKKIHRRPDISYFSKKQAAQMAHGLPAVPEFVIEIVSKTDLQTKQNHKMKNYREAGVKVVWEIYPSTKEVQVTRGIESILRSKNDTCSAAPVLPDFTISLKDLFKKPPLPKEES